MARLRTDQGSIINPYSEACEKFINSRFREFGRAVVKYKKISLLLPRSEPFGEYQSFVEALGKWSFGLEILNSCLLVNFTHEEAQPSDKIDILVAVGNDLDLSLIEDFVTVSRAAIREDAKLLLAFPKMNMDFLSCTTISITRFFSGDLESFLSSVFVLDHNIEGDGSWDMLPETSIRHDPDLKLGPTFFEIQLFDLKLSAALPNRLESARLSLDAEFHGEAQFSNPSIFRALVQIGVRINYSFSRLHLSQMLMSDTQNLDSTSRLAVATIYLYATCETRSLIAPSMFVNIKELLEETFRRKDEISKADYRWLVSCCFALAFYYENIKESEDAAEWYRKVLALEPSRASILLESKRVSALMKLSDGNSAIPRVQPAEFLNYLDEIKVCVFGRLTKSSSEDLARFPDFWFTELGDLFEGIGELENFSSMNIVNEQFWSKKISRPIKKFGLYELCINLSKSNEGLHRSNQELQRTLGTVAQRQRIFISRLLSNYFNCDWLDAIIRNLVNNGASSSKSFIIFGRNDVSEYIGGVMRQLGGIHLLTVDGANLKNRKYETGNFSGGFIIYVPFAPPTEDTLASLLKEFPMMPVIDLHSEKIRIIQ